MSKRMPDFIDVYVGNRIRMRRMLVGMSQDKLSESLGVTFQQVQKYEKGSNRVSASRLYHLAQVLGVPVQYFFEGLPDGAEEAVEKAATGVKETGEQAVITSFHFHEQDLQLTRAFQQIADPYERQRVIELVKFIVRKTDG
jgi:transcriptional regulator with XRE-family HTH domain